MPGGLLLFFGVNITAVVGGLLHARRPPAFFGLNATAVVGGLVHARRPPALIGSKLRRTQKNPVPSIDDNPKLFGK